MSDLCGTNQKTPRPIERRSNHSTKDRVLSMKDDIGPNEKRTNVSMDECKVRSKSLDSERRNGIEYSSQVEPEPSANYQSGDG
jgi:hypothetical protein